MKAFLCKKQLRGSSPHPERSYWMERWDSGAMRGAGSSSLYRMAKWSVLTGIRKRFFRRAGFSKNLEIGR